MKHSCVFHAFCDRQQVGRASPHNFFFLVERVVFTAIGIIQGFHSQGRDSFWLSTLSHLAILIGERKHLMIKGRHYAASSIIESIGLTIRDRRMR